jgi:hypothetical protein
MCSRSSSDPHKTDGIEMAMTLIGRSLKTPSSDTLLFDRALPLKTPVFRSLAHVARTHGTTVSGRYGERNSQMARPTIRLSVAEGCRTVADPFPQLDCSPEVGAPDKLRLIKRFGVEANGAHHEGPAGIGVTTKKIRQRGASVAGDTCRHSVDGESHGFLGEELRRWATLLGGADGDEKGDGHFLRILEAR